MSYEQTCERVRICWWDICSWGNRSRDALKLCIELAVPAASKGSWIPIIQRRASVILYKFVMMSHRLEHVVDSEMESCFLECLTPRPPISIHIRRRKMAEVSPLRQTVRSASLWSSSFLAPSLSLPLRRSSMKHASIWAPREFDK
jgi:hypothetical protein